MAAFPRESGFWRNLRNPLFLFALFIILIEGVLTISVPMTSGFNQGMLIFFMGLLAFLTLAAIFWITWFKPAHFYGPWDYADQDNFFRGISSKAEGIIEPPTPNREVFLQRLSEESRWYLRNNRFADAAQRLEEVVAFDPGNIVAHRTLGFLYLDQLRRFDKAIEHNLAVLEQIPNEFMGRFNLGVAYSNSEKPDEAEKVYLKCREIIEKEPNPNMLTKGKLYLFLGDAQARQSKKDQAKRNLVIAKQILEGLEPDKARDRWLRQTNQTLATVEAQCETVG